MANLKLVIDPDAPDVLGMLMDLEEATRLGDIVRLLAPFAQNGNGPMEEEEAIATLRHFSLNDLRAMQENLVGAIQAGMGIDPKSGAASTKRSGMGSRR